MFQCPSQSPHRYSGENKKQKTKNYHIPIPRKPDVPKNKMCGGAAKFEFNLTADVLEGLLCSSPVYLIDLPVLAGSPSSWSSEKLIRLINFPL
jgi:hypothetical protein